MVGFVFELQPSHSYSGGWTLFSEQPITARTDVGSERPAYVCILAATTSFFLIPEHLLIQPHPDGSLQHTMNGT